jgi:ubiquinone/menaquinone biosynthesis C-methylase UbiE
VLKIKYLLKSLISHLLVYESYGKWRFKDAVNIGYEDGVKSKTIRDIFRNVYGDDWPEEADPSSFVTITDLKCFARYLTIGHGQTLVDLGCGRGGPGMWVAREIGANLIGIDISSVAIEHATQRVSDFSLNNRASFYVADFCDTDLGDASCDGVMSVDSLNFALDETAAIKEVSRILLPGARFIFTAWELDNPFTLKEYRSVLRDKGFSIDVYNETPDWERRQRAVYERVLTLKEILISEMGKGPAKYLIREAQRALPRINRWRRILVVARKC